jgi:multiple sugar transport system ATP-binding protein
VQMRTEIKELHQRIKTTTVYVTHDQIEAMTMADKIVVMHDGIVEQMGSPLELYDNPRNMFVAGFIGSPAMNFVKGTIDQEGFAAQGGFRLPLKTIPQAAIGREAVYGLRPEHIMIDAKNGVPAEIVVIEPTGSETQVVLRVGGQDLIAIFRERILAKPGEMMPITASLQAQHLFDAATGERLAP